MDNIMTIREFINFANREYLDIDVCDDYNEACYIAYCGDEGFSLTEEGEKYFGELIDTVRIEYRGEYNCALILVNNLIKPEDEPKDPEENPKIIRKLIEFFFGAAGYCSEEKYDRWFKIAEE